jgi:beta-fructofuranosidase
VIDGQPENRFRDFRDPQVRRSEHGWTMVVGAGIREFGGCVLQFSSSDLEHWHYDGVLASAAYDPAAALNLGDVWECPQFLNVNGVWVLMLSAMVAGGEYFRQIYAIGEYDGRIFRPRLWGDFGHGDVAYATTTFSDAAGLPSTMSWFRELPEALPAGSPWAGAQSIVHHLQVVDDRLLAPFHPNLDAVLPAVALTESTAIDFSSAVRFVTEARGCITLHDTLHSIDIRFENERVQVVCDGDVVVDAACVNPTSCDLVIDAEWLEFVCGNVEGIYVARIPALSEGSISIS